MTLFQTLLLTVVSAVTVPVLFIMYERLAFREAKEDELGRVTIRPGPMSWVFGVFSFALCILFIYSTIESLLGKEDILFWVLLGPPLSLLMGYGAYIIFWARLRVSGAYVEHRGLSGWQKFDWDDVVGVFNSEIFGTRVFVKGSKRYPFWPYGYGFVETWNLFVMYEKPFERH